MASRKQVLVVDDDAAIRETLKVALQLEDYPVAVAQNGREALDVLQRSSESGEPGLILLDLMMPVMNGWEFIEAIAKVPACKDIPVVVFTAFAEKGQALGGARKILKKPIEMSDLMGVVKDYCDVA